MKYLNLAEGISKCLSLNENVSIWDTFILLYVSKILADYEQLSVRLVASVSNKK